MMILCLPKALYEDFTPPNFDSMRDMLQTKGYSPEQIAGVIAIANVELGVDWHGFARHVRCETSVELHKAICDHDTTMIIYTGSLQEITEDIMNYTMPLVVGFDVKVGHPEADLLDSLLAKENVLAKAELDLTNPQWRHSLMRDCPAIWTQLAAAAWLVRTAEQLRNA